MSQQFGTLIGTTLASASAQPIVNGLTTSRFLFVRPVSTNSANIIITSKTGGNLGGGITLKPTDQGVILDLNYDNASLLLSCSTNGNSLSYVGNDAVSAVESAESATPNNVGGALVKRDDNGNFKASIIESTSGGFKFPDSTVQTTASTGGSGSPGGMDTQVQFNDGGSFGGSAGLTFNKNTLQLDAGGEIHGLVPDGGHGILLTNGANGTFYVVNSDTAVQVRADDTGLRLIGSSSGELFLSGLTFALKIGAANYIVGDANDNSVTVTAAFLNVDGQIITTVADGATALTLTNGSNGSLSVVTADAGVQISVPNSPLTIFGPSNNATISLIPEGVTLSTAVGAFLTVRQDTGNVSAQDNNGNSYTINANGHTLANSLGNSLVVNGADGTIALSAIGNITIATSSGGVSLSDATGASIVLDGDSNCNFTGIGSMTINVTTQVAFNTAALFMNGTPAFSGTVANPTSITVVNGIVTDVS